VIFANRIAAIATMHQKERVITPILHQEFGITTIVPANFNTDQFGTFTREIERTGAQIAAARHKAKAALAITGLDLAIASEGSFFPHPSFPIIAANREILLLIDRANNLEIIGELFSTDTNFEHRLVKNQQEAEDFANRIGFPAHALIAIAPDGKITKGINTIPVLNQVIELSINEFPNQPIHLETDMRASHNPTRMTNIQQVTWDLVKKMQSLCPKCNSPGFAIEAYKPGLLCGYCGIPTTQILAEVYKCHKCGFSEERIYSNQLTADPQYCLFCNP